MIINFDDIKNYNNIIDIRSSDSYNKYHLDNTINIEKNILLSNPSNYLSKEKIYYLLCYEGSLSLFTSKILNVYGYHCYSINGGIKNIKNNI